jgi:hypothetical protein
MCLKTKNNLFHKNINKMAEQQQQPQVITLDSKNSVEILSSYVELAQGKGVFALPESDILKRCRDLLLKGVEDAEINIPTAKNLFVQAIMKGQSKGCYSLDDASILHKVCTFVSSNTDAPAAVPTQQVQAAPLNDDDSLSTLSDPVPLKSSGPRTI